MPFFFFHILYKVNIKGRCVLKKRIGIVCSEEQKVHQYIFFVHQDYVDAIKRAKGIPLLLPIVSSDDIEMQLEMIDGLMIIGGGDVNPLLYHQNPMPKLGETDYLRDCYEMTLIQKAAYHKIPILGICRGIQIINIVFKGTLFQDLAYAPQKVFLHAQKERREYASHLIHIKKDSFLYPIFQESVEVNSFHHQAIDCLGDGLHVVAYSDDQVIEAIEHDVLPIWGVQFHPEAMCLTNPKMQEIFQQFIRQC